MTRIVLSIPSPSRRAAYQPRWALDKNDQRLLRLMTKRVAVALREQKHKGVVQSEQGPGQYMLWEIAR